MDLFLCQFFYAIFSLTKENIANWPEENDQKKLFLSYLHEVNKIYSKIFFTVGTTFKEHNINSIFLKI